MSEGVQSQGKASSPTSLASAERVVAESDDDGRYQDEADRIRAKQALWEAEA